MNLGERQLVVFDSSLRANFYPMSLTRATFDLAFATRTLLRTIENSAGTKASYLFVPDYLREITEAVHPDAKVNSPVSGKCLLVNSLTTGGPELWQLIDQALSDGKRIRYFDTAGNLVFALIDQLENPKDIEKSAASSENSKVIPPEIEERAICRFPWKLVEYNPEAIGDDFARKYKPTPNGTLKCETRGSKIAVSESADIERFVTMDSRVGPIIVEDGARIQSFSHLTGPCFIGRGSIVKSARIREGTTLGEFCRISGEVEESIISSYTNKNHEGFIGHSLVGSWVNLGAMTTNSDLKNTYGEIRVNIKGKDVKTSSIKVGVMIGDMAKTGIGCMINSGKSIGVSSHVLGNVAGDVPSFSIYSSTGKNRAVEMYLESAIETQRRMMSRRGITISAAYISMMRVVFKATQKDRARLRVLKGKFKY